MNRILIIGGAGFIGLNLANYYKAKNYYVDIIDDFSRGKKDKFLLKVLNSKKVNFVNLDLSKQKLNFKRLKKNYHYIFQLAAILGVENVLRKPFEVLKKNFNIQINSLKIANLQKKLKKFIFFSTSEVHFGSLQHFKMQFPTKTDFPIALENLNNSRSTYSLSKIYCEALLHHSNINFLIFRPYNIYGPRMGMSHVIPQVLKKINYQKKNGIINITSPKHTRSFCYIEDAILQIVNLVKNNKIKNRVFNIGNNKEEITIYNLTKVLLKICGRNDLRIKIERKKNLYSPIRRVPYIREIKKFTPLLTGCKLTLQWYKENFFNVK